METEPVQPTEREKVEFWRLKVLVDAGYDVPVAERLSRRSDVDLHRAVELLEHGCRPEVAVEILL